VTPGVVVVVVGVVDVVVVGVVVVVVGVVLVVVVGVVDVVVVGVVDVVVVGVVVVVLVGVVAVVVVDGCVGVVEPLPPEPPVVGPVRVTTAVGFELALVVPPRFVAATTATAVAPRSRLFSV
jgi:hypothetical protein